MNNKRSFDFGVSAKAERILMGLSIAGLIVASLFLFNDDLYNRITGSSTKEDTSRTLMGVVTEKVNDTRYKSSLTIQWVGAKKKQNVRAGDSLFTGENSRSHVELTDGNQMTLDQNTLVVFNEKKFMDLGMGNFRFQVDGALTLTIRGKKTTIEGSHSDIQIIVPKEKGAKPQVRLLQGKVNLHIQGQASQTLSLQKLETLNLYKEAERAIASTPAHNKNDQNMLRPTLNPEPVNRRLQLYDVFEAGKDNSLVRRSILSEEVQALSPLEETVALTSSQPDPIIIDEGGARVILTAGDSESVQGYVFEVSTDREFPAEQTRVKWNRDRNMPLRLTVPGTFFYRVRGVNQKTELTSVSNPVTLVLRPKEKTIPLAVQEPRRQVAPLTIRRPNPVEKPRAIQARIEKAPPQISPKQVAKKAESIPLSIRKPSAVASSSIKATPEERTNQTYTSSRVDIETGTFTVFSPDEKDVGRTNPYAYSIGIRSKHWFDDRNGAEGIARMKAGNMNATANGINPLDLEARYHYRPASSWFGRTNTSLFTGIEVYRNIGRGYFAQKYDLAKLGFALDFPVGSHWDMGGDVAFGIGADQTKKYEALGRINYYFRRRYSLGLGYRLSLLEAGSVKTAPLDFPYKETWGEGFFTFRWHY